MVYDGAGRMIVSYKTDGFSDTTWSHALSISDDYVATKSTYSLDSVGNTLMVHSQDRFHSAKANASGRGDLEGPTGLDRPSRSQYVTMYFDAANRMTDSVNIGTNGGSAYTRPSTVPTRSDTALVSSVLYDAAGRVFQTIDPMNRAFQTTYDLLGRRIRTIENMVNGTPGAASDVTVDFTYNGQNQQLTIKALQSGGGYQTTAFVYGATTARGDMISDNRMLIETQYPDKSTGVASSSEKRSQTSNAMGERLTETDENGSTHTFSYDVLGRITADTVTTLGSGVDGTQRRVGTTYNTQGLIDKLTTYSDTAGSTVLMQIQREYNGFGQLTKEYQSDNGVVVTATTRAVAYRYTAPSASGNYSRLNRVDYPDGRQVAYSYGLTTLDNALSRVSQIADQGWLEFYTYLGLDTVVIYQNFSAGFNRTFVKFAAESFGDGGDQYVGLDRFNRVVDQRWIQNGTTTILDQYRYGYDRNGNRLFRENTLSAPNSELYTYDGINRVVDMQRGTLNGARNAIVGSPTRTQAWTLDCAGQMRHRYRPTERPRAVFTTLRTNSLRSAVRHWRLIRTGI